jgi:hypothetical protein
MSSAATRSMISSVSSLSCSIAILLVGQGGCPQELRGNRRI